MKEREKDSQVHHGLSFLRVDGVADRQLLAGLRGEEDVNQRVLRNYLGICSLFEQRNEAKLNGYRN